MTSENEHYELDQNTIGTLKETFDSVDNLTGEQIGDLLWEKLTHQEQEAVVAYWDEFERLLLYGDGKEPTGIRKELFKSSPECEIRQRESESEIIQQLMRAAGEAMETIIDVMAEPVRIMLDLLMTKKLKSDDYKDIDFIGERDEAITRGLRDRSPTTRTRSARITQASGARDAQRAGCTKGLHALFRST